MKINKLSPQVADMIAAGEVVERPASVVKELVENSIDAGAASITVEIRRGGMELLRVTDDGSGIAPEDAPTAFLRHATSKISDERGLEAIATLGFRGEALAAIAAVSRVELTTRERGAATGVTLTLEAGADVGGGAITAGCPEGTTIIVRDLFFNTPARLKFMKTDNSESAAAIAAALRCALSHPELAFRMIKDGEEVFRTTGSGDLRDAAYSLLGREFSLNLLEVPESGDETASARGLITPPDAVRGNRGMQYFFINGRHVKSQLLTAALEQAYRTLLPGGRFPGSVLYITIRPAMVDVNVHPAKTEVKFMFERAVFDLVHYAVKGALGLSLKMEYSAMLKSESSEAPSASQANYSDIPALPSSHNPIPEPQTEASSKSYVNNFDFLRQNSHFPALSEPNSNHQIVIQELFSHTSEPLSEPAAPLPDHRIIGEVYGGYIVVETPSTLIFIDKHAAHERLIFDRLKSRSQPSMPQMLLSPLIVEPGAEYASLILENLAFIEAQGFSIEQFGSAGTLAIRQIPSELEQSDVPSLIEELAESIKLGSRPGSLGREDEILSTVACKAAIKLGWSTDLLEFAPLVDAVLRGEITTCPHGRPISFRLPRETIEKAIKRK